MRTRRWLVNAVTAAILVTLGACGGGGGGGGDDAPPGPTIDISTANRDSVVHAAVAGVWGLTLGVTAPLASGTPGYARSVASWLQMQGQRAAGAAARREQPSAVKAPVVQPCAFGGSISVTWDDADNNNELTVGDVLTSVADNCQLVAGETTHGTMVITSLSDTVGRMAMTPMSFETARHAITLNGSVRLEDVSADTMQTTTEGLVTVAVRLKHLAPVFTDTVTLQEGFVARETIANGEIVSTFDGLVGSAAAGGLVRLTAPMSTPIRQVQTHDYPYTGTLQLKGRNSSLQMTVLSADQVQLALDADGNGSFESSTTVTWDWLL